MSITAYEGWAIVELMGHVRMAGQIREVECFGTKMLHLDVPAVPDADVAGFTTFVSGASLYRVTPTTEAIAVGITRASRPRPVHPYDVQLQPLTPRAALASVEEHERDCVCPECLAEDALEDAARHDDDGPGF